MLNDPITATVEGLCQLSGLGKSTIWALIAKNELDAISVGHRRLVIIESYRRYVERQRAKPPQDCRRNKGVPALGSSGAPAFGARGEAT
jgi:hypothetical protein